MKKIISFDYLESVKVSYNTDEMLNRNTLKKINELGQMFGGKSFNDYGDYIEIIGVDELGCYIQYRKNRSYYFFDAIEMINLGLFYKLFTVDELKPYIKHFIKYDADNENLTKWL